MLSSQAGLLSLCEQHKELMIFEDYTFLITPALRAVEAVLKHILVLHGVRIGTGTGHFAAALRQIRNRQDYYPL